jgi:hypothetical protein
MKFCINFAPCRYSDYDKLQKYKMFVMKKLHNAKAKPEGLKTRKGAKGVKFIICCMAVMFSLQTVSAQYTAYNTVMQQGDRRHESGVKNLNNRRYDAAIKDFTDAIRYFEQAKKAPSKPDDAISVLDRKIAESQAKMTQAKDLKAKQQADAATTLKLSVTKLYFPAADSMIRIIVTTNRKDWKVDAKQLPDWCEPSRSINNTDILVNVRRNSIAKSRSCTFEVTAGPLKEIVEIFQDAMAVSLNVSRRELSFDADADSASYLTVGVDCNTDWEVLKNSGPETVGIEKTADSVRVYMKATNKDPQRREYDFEIAAGETVSPIKITVYHEAAKKQPLAAQDNIPVAKTTGKKTETKQQQKQQTQTVAQQTKTQAETKPSTTGSYATTAKVTDAGALKVSGAGSTSNGTGLIVAGALTPVVGTGIGFLIKSEKTEQSGNAIVQRKYSKVVPFALIGAAIGTGLVVWGLKAKSANKTVTDYTFEPVNTPDKAVPSLNFQINPDGFGLTYNF